MEWVVAIGLLVAALAIKHMFKYLLDRFLVNFPNGLLGQWLGRKGTIIVVAAISVSWYLMADRSAAELTPDSLASDIRSGQKLPRQVGVQVRLERVEAVNNKVIVAHIVDVEDPDELPTIISNIEQWDASDLCDNLMLLRTQRAGIQLVARFRTRDAVNYRSIELTPETCGG